MHEGPWLFLISLTLYQILRAGAFAQEAIHYQPTLFKTVNESQYFGRPSPDIDAAWDRLLENQVLRVSASELALEDRNTITPLGESGFLASTSFYHEAHCVVSQQ